MNEIKNHEWQRPLGIRLRGDPGFNLLGTSEKNEFYLNILFIVFLLLYITYRRQKAG